MMNEWRPIESAPKNGEHFIGACKCATSDEIWATGDVWWHRDHWCSDGDGIVDVFAWMPLPEPPAQEQSR